MQGYEARARARVRARAMAKANVAAYWSALLQCNEALLAGAYIAFARTSIEVDI